MLFLLLTLLSRESSARVLTWNDCLSIVSKNNPELAAARSNLSSAEELAAGSWSGFLPVLTGSVNANYNFPNSSTSATAFTSIAGNTIGSTQSDKVAYSSALTLSYNLFSGFRDKAVLARSRANYRIATANLEAVNAKVSYELRQAFVNLDYAKSYVALTDSIRERRFQNERLVRAQYETGRENQGSYLLSRSVLEQADYERFQAQNRAVIATQAFAHVLGEDTIQLDISGEIPVSAPTETADIEALLPLTPVHRTEEAQVALTQANINFASSAFYPSLDFSASVVNRSDLLYLNDKQQWNIGLSLSVPIFSGFKTYHDTKSAGDLEKVAEYNRMTSDFDTINQLRLAFFNFQESLLKLKADLGSLNAITVQEKIARKQYNNGLLKFENWDIIEGNLIIAQKAALGSQRDRVLAESNWRQLQGQGDLP